MGAGRRSAPAAVQALGRRAGGRVVLRAGLPAQGRTLFVRLEVDDTQVLGEWLYTFPHGRKKKLFERSGAEEITFGRALTGENQRIRRLTRPNSLYLSAAASNNHPLLGALYADLINKVMFAQHGEEDEKLRLHLTKFLLNETDFAPALNKLLRLADLGVERPRSWRDRTTRRRTIPPSPQRC